MELLVTLAMALAFCGVHLFVGKLRFLQGQPRSSWLSFAGGVAVSYIFMHVLPELAAHGEVFAEESGLSLALAEGLVYSLALAGLAMFYGLERAFVAANAGRQEHGEKQVEGLFWLHIAAMTTLAGFIAYLLVHREDPEPLGLALFFLALLLHFVSADYGLRADHPKLYDARGRWVIAIGTLGGWAAGQAFALPELVIGCLFAFVAGAIILLTLKEELPEESESRFVPFLAGAGIYAAMVLGEMWLAAQ